jgi:hypothetical protein
VRRLLHSRPRLIAAVVPALALAACGSSSPRWKDVQRVTVTVSRPGLPPPGGTPRTTSFTTQADVAKVTAALNAPHIARASLSSNALCAGGTQVAITITRANAATTHLSGYIYRGKTSGGIGGDVSGFLSAVGVSPST